MKKKLLLLTTGGTIASVASELGLQPGQSGEELLASLGPIPYDIVIHDILRLDSTNIQPEEWQLIAKKVYEMREGFDGVVITHGTDTMAYTASMLTFMLQGIERPVVLTGSQLPITNPLSDAPYNLRCAMAMAASGRPVSTSPLAERCFSAAAASRSAPLALMPSRVSKRRLWPPSTPTACNSAATCRQGGPAPAGSIPGSTAASCW